MSNNRELIIVPISSLETINSMKNKIMGVDIFGEPLINIEADYETLEESLYNLKGTIFNRAMDIVSVFTSKNAAKTLIHYLHKNNKLSEYSRIFEKVICIGPATLYTLKQLLERYAPGHSLVISEVPLSHNSNGLVNLLENTSATPLLWCSKFVDRGLKAYVQSRGGYVFELYDIKLDNDKLMGSLQLLGKYKKVYMIFMSIRSLEAIRLLDPLKREAELYGIFISKRVFEKAEPNLFNELYVYEDGDMDKFYEFVKGVIQ